MEFIRFIGQGTFGTVEEILFNGARVAIKKLKVDGDKEELPTLKRRFKREVQYQASFNHPNIVNIFTSDLDSENPWFIMPLACCSLGEEYKYNISLPPEHKLHVIRMILDGVEAIHNAGQIHRDLKPQNILRFHHPNNIFSYAISDFGLVADRGRENTTILTMTSAPMGTLNYISPECYLDARNGSSIQSDIYSLGVVIKFIIDGDTGLPMNERSSSSFAGPIISKCTKPNPEDRYKNISQLRTDLESLLSNRG